MNSSTETLISPRSRDGPVIRLKQHRRDNDDPQDAITFRLGRMVALCLHNLAQVVSVGAHFNIRASRDFPFERPPVIEFCPVSCGTANYHHVELPSTSVLCVTNFHGARTMCKLALI